jgi:hypothetical protein
MSDDWLDKRLDEAELQDQREITISGGITPLWNNLCAVIGQKLEAYGKKCPSEHVKWSGKQPESIWIEIGKKDPIVTHIATEQRNCKASLDSKAKAVTFKYSKAARGRTAGVLRIGINGDGQVSFIDNASKPISVEQAAQWMLDAFLFPTANEDADFARFLES